MKPRRRSPPADGVDPAKQVEPLSRFLDHVSFLDPVKPRPETREQGRGLAQKTINERSLYRLGFLRASRGAIITRPERFGSRGRHGRRQEQSLNLADQLVGV